MAEWVASLDFGCGAPELEWLTPSAASKSLRCVKQLVIRTGDRHVELAMGAGREDFIHLLRLEQGTRTIGIVLSGFARCPEIVDDEKSLTFAQQVAYAYLRWGEDCVRHLQGQWAFTLVEPARGTAIAARDALGTRPLFYRHDGVWLLGNRARRLAEAIGLPVCLPDDESVRECVAGVAARPWSTMYRNVRRLPPGCYLVIQGDRCSVKNWWQPVPWNDSTVLSEAEQSSRFRNALMASVRDSCDHASKACIALSGGVDSSAIAALAKQLADDRLIRYPVSISARFPEYPECDETTRIVPFLDDLKLESHWVEPNPAEDVSEVLEKSDSPRQALWVPVAFALARGVEEQSGDLIMIGTLGDIMGGLPSRWSLLLEESRELRPRTTFGRLRAKLRHQRSALSLLRNSPPKWLVDRRNWVSRHMPSSAEWTAVLARIRDYALWVIPGPFGARAEESFCIAGVGDSEALASEWNFGQFGVEVAFPYLDRRVVEASLVVGPNMRQRGHLSRWILRDLIKGRVPDAIRLNRKKTVFNEFYAHVRRIVVQSDMAHAPNGATATRFDELEDEGRLARLPLNRNDIDDEVALSQAYYVALTNKWLSRWPKVDKEVLDDEPSRRRQSEGGPKPTGTI